MTVLGPPLSSVASAHTSGLLLVLTRQSEACRPRRLILVAFVVSHAKWVVFEVGVWTVGKHVVNLHNGLLGGWKTKSSYGQVADVGITKGGRGNFDPWDQLRMQSVKGDAEALTAARKNVASQQAARTTFKPTIRSKSHPLISHCRKIMREQARKREGVMRVEGVKLILTALEYGWTPDIVLCAPLQAAELNKAAPQLRDDDVLLVGTAEVVSCALLQPWLDPAMAVGPPPRNRPRHKPERAMLLGVQDPSNLGSLLRTGAALGVTTVYLLPGCPDPFNPIVIRSSAGAALLLEYGTEEDALKSSRAGMPVLCADAHDGEAINPRHLHFGGEHGMDGWILALGHESRGLPEEWLERGTVITLPVHVESLGVAAAGAILLDRLTEREYDTDDASK